MIVTGLASGLLVSKVSAQAAPELDAGPDHCVAGGVGIIQGDDTGVEPAEDDGSTGEEMAVEKPEVTDSGDGTGPEVINEEEPAVEPPKCEGVPIDWVKRGDGGEDNPVIYYSMGAGGPLNETGGGEIASDAGKDDALPLPKIKISGVKPVERKHSKPTAIVKAGRVFLRH